MATLTQASNNWWSRKDDERFVSLHDLHNHCLDMRERSIAPVMDVAKLKAVPAQELQIEGAVGKDLVFMSDKGIPATMSNNAFQQLGNLATFPSSYMTRLPAQLAAANVNHALQNYERDNAQVLISKYDDGLNIRSFNSETYGRIWNSQITAACVEHFGDGISGQWKVPGEFGKAIKVTKANTTLFGGERDIFIFLADEDHKIEVKNRRNGETGLLSRGFFISNSETGNSTLMIKTFYFDYVCANRIVWGAEDVKTIKIRHSKHSNERWLDEIAPMLADYGNNAASGVEHKIIEAQAKKVEEPLKLINTKLALPMITAKAIASTHEKEESRPMETLWDISTGITAFAKSIPNQDERVGIESLAGKVLDMAA